MSSSRCTPTWRRASTTSSCACSSSSARFATPRPRASPPSCPTSPYARKDQKSKSRDPVATRYVAGLFEAVGTDCVVTLNVHNLAAFQNAFRCRAENLEAAGLLGGARAAPMLGRGRGRGRPPARTRGIKRAEAFRRARLATERSGARWRPRSRRNTAAPACSRARRTRGRRRPAASRSSSTT